MPATITNGLRRFAAMLDGELLSGVIDRLVLVYQGSKLVAADVIDFKSDRVDGENLQERIEHYRPQLNGYRRAVSKFANLPLSKISTRLAFPSAGKVVNLELIETSVGPPEKKPANKKRASKTPTRKKPVRKPSFSPQASKTAPAKTNSVAKPKFVKNEAPTETPKSSKQQRTFWD
ncbi:MAG: hypothetical protein AB8B55_17805 [Mariniblastus sp.]